MTFRRTFSLGACAAIVACGGDSAKAPETDPAAAASTAELAEFKKQQQAYVDSVLNAASSAREIANRLGKNYDVGSIKMRDSVAALAAGADCLARGRKVDPYLGGTVTVWVNMSIIGSDVMRVQESSWTSPAGKLVDACINQALGTTQLDPSFGAPKAYLVQVQFK